MLKVAGRSLDLPNSTCAFSFQVAGSDHAVGHAILVSRIGDCLKVGLPLHRNTSIAVPLQVPEPIAILMIKIAIRHRFYRYSTPLLRTVMIDTAGEISRHSRVKLTDHACLSTKTGARRIGRVEEWTITFCGARKYYTVSRENSKSSFIKSQHSK